MRGCIVLFYFSCMLQKIICLKEKVIKLGGFFSPFNADSSRNETGAQGLAAFLFAVNEINQQYELLPNHEIVISVTDPGLDMDLISTTTAGMYMGRQAFNGTGAHLVIGCVDEYQTIATNNILTKYKLIQISAIAKSAPLVVGSDFPYKFRVAPTDTFSGMALQFFAAAKMGFSRLVSFTSDDFTQLSSEVELNDESYAIIKYLDRIIVDPKKVRFRKALLQAKETGAKAFYIFADPATTARLLEQGYYLGVFVEGTVVIGSFDNSGPALYPYFSPHAPVETILKGYLGIERIPNYYVQHTEAGRSFVQRWRNQTSTAGSHGDPSFCSDAMDADGQRLLQLPAGGCAGYVFSSFAASGDDLDEAAPYTYDAVYAAAHGLHSLLYGTNAAGINTDLLATQLLTNVSFNGATGDIKFASGMLFFDGAYVDAGAVTATDDGAGSVSSSYIGRGDRELGFYFKILNFNAESYRADNVSGGFVQVGLFNTDGVFRLCGDSSISDEGDAEFECLHSIVYNTADNSKPHMRPDDIRLNLPSKYLRNISLALSTVSLFIVCFISFVLFKFRSHSLVKAVQPFMTLFTMLGLILASICSIFSQLKVSLSTCYSLEILGHLAFFLILLSIYVKTWRVHKLMVLATLEKKKITNMDALKRFFIALICCCIVLAVIQVLARREVLATVSDANNRETFEFYCSAAPEVSVSFLVCELIALIRCASLARSLTALPGGINESDNILLVYLIITITTGTLYPSIQLQYVNHMTGMFLVSIGFSVASAACAIVLYGRRVWQMLLGYNVSKSFRVMQDPAMEEEAAEETKELLRITNVAIRAIKSDDGKCRLCVAQIELWYKILSSTQVIFQNSRENYLSNSNVQEAAELVQSVMSKSIYKHKRAAQYLSHASDVISGRRIHSAGNEKRGSGSRNRSYVVNDK